MLDQLLERLGRAFACIAKHQSHDEYVAQMTKHPAHSGYRSGRRHHVHESPGRSHTAGVVEFGILDDPQHRLQILTKPGQGGCHELDEALARHITSEPETGLAGMLPQLRSVLRRFR